MTLYYLNDHFIYTGKVLVDNHRQKDSISYMEDLLWISLYQIYTKHKDHLVEEKLFDEALKRLIYLPVNKPQNYEKLIEKMVSFQEVKFFVDDYSEMKNVVINYTQKNNVYAAQNKDIEWAEQGSRVIEYRANLEKIIQEQQARIELLEEQNNYLQQSYDIISNAFFWKITKPLRSGLDILKRIRQNADRQNEK